jgi:predicted dithiol-disulfide oxidoreductase (DUF899 family)
MKATKLHQPEAVPPVVDRAAFDTALSEQVAREKEVTRHNDRVSAARRRLPMVEVENYTFAGPKGPTTLVELFEDRYLLLVQNVMFDPGWDEGWRAQRGWNHTWVSSYDTSYHYDWGWTQRNDQGQEGQLPGYSYYLLRDGRPYLTYMTTARGTEAILPVAQIMDRTVYGRQQEWEDSPAGWPQYPTYG